MRRNPIWLTVFLYGTLGAVMFSLPFFTSFNKLAINLPFFCGMGIVGYASIVIYAIFKIGHEMNQTFEKLNDKDKLVDLLEDQLNILSHAKSCEYLANSNIDKIKILAGEKKDEKA